MALVAASLATLPAAAQSDAPAAQVPAPQPADEAVDYPSNITRTLVELTGLMAIGTTWYLLDKEVNRVDWDHPDPRDRLTTEVLRFDDNTFRMNNIIHPGVGASYYMFARANDLSAGSSAAATFATSAFWEILVELHEKVSVNDLIMTPAGGVALGEFFYQLGEYANSAPDPTGLHDALASLVGLPRYVHNRLDRRPPQPGPVDHLGLSARFDHRLEFSYVGSLRVGVDGADRPRPRQGFEFAAEVDNGRGSRSAGRIFFGFIDARLDAFDTTAWATFDSWEVLDGMSVGYGTAFDYLLRQFPGQRDRLGIAHIVGPHLHLERSAGPLEFTARLRAHPSFAGVETLALRRWRRLHPDERVRNVVSDKGYYYAWGGSTQAELRLAGWDVELELSGLLGRWWSIDGIDRHEERITDPAPLADTAWIRRVGLTWLGPVRPLRLGAQFVRIERFSEMGGVHVGSDEWRLTGRLGLVF